MTDLGKIAWILGMHITRDHKVGWITLSQEKFSKEILERFRKSDVWPISTPTLANEHLTKLKSVEVNVKQYQQAISALMYPMLGTCPNLAYTVATLGRHAATPGPNYQCALDQAFHYLQATHSSQLIFKCKVTGSMTLHGYVDADWASDINNHKSTSGFVFMLAGGTISWSSKKQGTVALSSTKSKYIAHTHVVKEAIWLR